MSQYGAATLALGTFLQGFTRGGRVVLEGEVYAPEQDRGYVSGRISAYTRNPYGFGANCVYREDISYQVSIHRPAREGPLPAAQLTDALVVFFPRGAGLVLGTGRHLTFLNVSANPAIISGGWLSVPVVVSSFCTE